MRDKLAQLRGQQASTVDAIEMADRLLIIAGQMPRVRLPVASSVNTSYSVRRGPATMHLHDLVSLQIRKLAYMAMQTALLLRHMIEFCLTAVALSGCPRSAGH